LIIHSILISHFILRRQGYILFKGNFFDGNAGFSDGQLLTMELNMDTGTLHFFIDGMQQPIFVHGINEPVKFWV
jgi:hypothetical protein